MTFENPGAVVLTLGVGIIGVLSLACPPNFGDEYGRCLQHIPYGHDLARFLEKVLTEMQRKKFNEYCKNYTYVLHCTKSVLQMCPEKTRHHERYFHIANRVMNFVCYDTYSARYTNNIMCIVTQRYGLLAKRCDRLFNLRKIGSAQTEHCKLNEQLLVCKDRLIRSACSYQAADVGFEINKIVYEQSLLAVPAGSCNITLKTMAKHTNAFSYTPSCRPAFPNRMAYCSELFRQEIPRVYSLVPVIVRGDFLQVDKMCKAEEKYKSCVASVIGNCPTMAKKIEETFQWRLPHDMAKYVCSIVYEYKRNLYCYQKMIKNVGHSPTTKCESKRNATVHLLQKFYYYKCSLQSGSKLEEVKRHSEELIECFYSQAYTSCKNQRAADILKPLLQIKYGIQQFHLNCDGTISKTIYSPVSSAASHDKNIILDIFPFLGLLSTVTFYLEHVS